MSVVLVLLILFLTVVALGLVLAVITRPELRGLLTGVLLRKRNPNTPSAREKRP